MDAIRDVQTLNNNNGGQDLHKWMQAFIVDRKTSQVSRHTIAFYNVEFRRFLSFCEGVRVREIESISAEMLRAYLLHLTETGRNPGGVNAGYRAIKSFLLWYENEVEPPGWKNPIRKVKTPRLDVKPLDPVELGAVHKLIDTCGGDTLLDLRDKALFMFLLDTGARAFEVCAVDLDDVDLLRGTVIIRKGKGSKPRIVCLGKRTRKVLRQYGRARSDNNRALWVTNGGERLTYWGLNQIVRRRAVKAGIDKPGLHDFRRAFALNCLRAGMDVYSLQKLMGHSDLQVLRRYLAQTDEDLKAAFVSASPVDNAGL